METSMFFLFAIGCSVQVKQIDTDVPQAQDTAGSSAQEPTSEPQTPVDTAVEEPSSPTSEPSQDSGPTPETCYQENRVDANTLLPDEPSFGISESTTVDGFTDDYLYDASNYIKVGVRREWGGSIVFFGLADGSVGMNDTNTIDANDTGREVQVAFYDPDRVRQGCAHNASCATALDSACPNSITYLGWNPVQGGNRCNNGSPISNISNQNGRLDLSVQPLHWNPNWNDTDCDSSGCSDTNLAYLQSDVQVGQRLRFVRTHVVELQYTLTELAGLDHARNLQELPTLYSAIGNLGPDLWRLMDANGNQIDINIPANDGFFYKNFTSSAPWTTLQNEDLSYGVGILYENGLQEFQGWQNRSLPFNNVRSLIQFGIPAYSTIHARAYLILGSFGTIQGEATVLMNILPPFGSLDNPAHNSTTNGTSVTIRGWALDNKGVQTVEAIIDDTHTVPLQYGIARPDVCIAWPGYPQCEQVGYEATVDLSFLPTAPDCAHQIEIIATDTDGNSRVIARELFYLP